MSDWVEYIKSNIPEYAKDIRLNLDTVIKRSSLEFSVVNGCALAAAFAAGNIKVRDYISGAIENETERSAALTAAALMAMNNTWYPYIDTVDDKALTGLPAQLRMNAISTHGGTTKEKFEAYSLAASIVGKCELCINSHYAALKQAGYTVEQLRDIGRISAVITSVCKIIL